jgi:acyl-CoA thioesterase
MRDKIAELREKWTADHIASFFNMALLDLFEGYSKVTIKLAPDHRTIIGFVFGGVIMSLADQAFFYGANSIYTPSVATQFNMHFFETPQVGEDLFAKFQTIPSTKTICICEITVTNQRGSCIAKATGSAIPLV